MTPVTVAAPPSKSISHRALMAAALAQGQSVLDNTLRSQDLEVTRACLQAGGVRIEDQDGRLLVRGCPQGLRGGTMAAPVLFDVHESGTSCRLLLALAAAGQGSFAFRGAGRMHQRPVGQLVAALEDQGARVQWQGQPGCPPLVLHGQGLAGGNLDISLEESSQYLSGLLLAGPLARRPLSLGVSGQTVVSWPYVALTLQVLADFGVQVEAREKVGEAFVATDWRTLDEVRPGRLRLRVTSGAYQSRSYRVEGDYSSASYFLAAGALVGPLTVTGLRRDSMQGDRAMVDILAAMGARVAWDGPGLTVAPAPLRGVEVDMRRCPDIVPTVAVLAACAQGATRISGVAHLRLKESDRLAAMAGELGKAGVRVDLHQDGLTIHPGPLAAGQPIAFSAHGDHRVAMSLSLLELAGVGVELDDRGCVAKSFPGFFEAWAGLRRPS